MGLCAAGPNKSFALPNLGCEDCKRIIEALPRQIVNACLLIDQKWSGFENSNAFARTLSVNKGQPKSKWGFLIPSVSLQTGRRPDLSISKAHVRCRFRSLRAASVHGRAESYTRRPNIGMVLRLLPYSSRPTSRMSTCILLSLNNSRQLFFSNSKATTMQKFELRNDHHRGVNEGRIALAVTGFHLLSDIRWDKKASS